MYYVEMSKWVGTRKPTGWPRARTGLG